MTKSTKNIFLLIVCIFLVSSCSSNVDNHLSENLSAENTVLEFYTLIKDNKIDEAYNLTHYEPQYEEYKEIIKNEVKKDDWSTIAIEILGSEKINENISTVFVTIVSPYDDEIAAELHTNIKVFVLDENDKQYVIQQVYNIPEKYQQGIVMDDSFVRPEHVFPND